ncbi:MAG: tRNA pseudouridine(55) synthase TruB [bacterium]
MDGILLVDKEPGMTSHDVVQMVRKRFAEQRVGHAGTLDPIASGLLVLFLGKATKFVKYFMDHDKTYEAEIAIGIATDTDDITGKITASLPCESLDPTIIDAALAHFVGASLQQPPVYAAIKVDGRKLYEYARKNIPLPDVAPRGIEIYRFERTSAPVATAGVCRFSFRVAVSKGTYIRSLCRDLGAYLGYPATMSALRRTTAGAFSIADAMSLASVATGEVQLLDPLVVLRLPRVVLTTEQTFQVKNGAFLPLSAFSKTEDTVVVDQGGKPLAVYEYDAIRKVMRLAVML